MAKTNPYAGQAQKNAEEAEHMVEEQLLTALIGNIKGDIPEVMFTNEVENMLRDYENRLSQQGISMDMYLQYTGMTKEKMTEELRPQAERQVKAQLALEYIAKTEKFDVSKDEIEAEYQRVADSYKIDTEKAKTYIPEDVIRRDILSRKAVDLIKKEAVVTDAPEEAKKADKAPTKKAQAKKAAAEKAPAKKAPAKKTAAKKADK